MKIILEVRGHEMTFTEKELEAILEDHFARFMTDEELGTNPEGKPNKDQCFMVNPQSIDRTYFENMRKDGKQESVRKRILKAFAEVDKNPEKYDRIFWTFVPEKKWAWKTAKGIQEYACNLGNHMADWIEQALEWAQRIYNNQTDSIWYDLCNRKDTEKWFRLIIVNCDYMCYVGDSMKSAGTHAPCDMYVVNYKPDMRMESTVPLVVLYD